ncbi:MAG TPA: rhodanese-like domain-containing protein [Tepidisphaeraceae bacterium]|nr:rhodanese-like domain-containing protein [Tepidisphaeraceae bacterium]
MKTVTLGEIEQLIQSGRTLNILDVRTPAEFARVHARGARLMPLGELTPSAVAAQPQQSGEPIYLICQSGSRAARAWQTLANAGVESACCIEGGTAAWEAFGLPVERGASTVISLERQVRIAAGSLVFAGTLLAWRIHPLFLAIPAFVGAGLIFAGVTDYCGMGMLLAQMPWNRRSPNAESRK